MKNLVLALGVVLSSIGVHAAAELMPVGHSWCLNSNNPDVAPLCSEGKDFYVGSDGRCGCLASSEFRSPRRCAMERFVCETNESYASLFKPHVMMIDGRSVGAYAGCGCFTTADGMHIN